MRRAMAAIGVPLLGLAALLLAGCGMYGDLYLEGEVPRPEVTEEPPIMLEESGGADENEPGENQPGENQPDGDQPKGQKPDAGGPAARS